MWEGSDFFIRERRFLTTNGRLIQRIDAVLFACQILIKTIEVVVVFFGRGKANSTASVENSFSALNWDIFTPDKLVLSVIHSEQANKTLP
ncbi:Aspartate--tRNA(Asp/Asn) ligase [Trichinella pseudospiralis]